MYGAILCFQNMILLHDNISFGGMSKVKLLRLSLNRIPTHFTENKLFFILFFLGIMASSVMLIFYYGNVMTFKNGSFDDNAEIRAYEIDFKIPQKTDKDTIVKIADFKGNCKLQDIIFYSVLDVNGDDTLEFDKISAQAYLESPEIVAELGSQNFMLVGAYLSNNADVVYYPKPHIFTDEQQHELVAITPKMTRNNIELAGKSYKVVSYQTIDHYVIPIEKYFESNIRTARIKLYTEKKLSRNMVFRYTDYLKKELTKAFPDTQIEILSPSFWYGIEDNANQKGFAKITVLCIIAMTAFMFLLKYMMESSYRSNVIMMMVGAKKRNILEIVIIESVILTSLPTLSAIGLHSIFYQEVFSKINIYEGIVYNLSDYVVIYAVMLLISLIVNVPFFITCCKNKIRLTRSKLL